MTDTNDIRSTLNDLIETLKDGEEGFRTSADNLKNAALRAQFQSFANQRSQFASELQSLVAGIGGKAETSGSTGGALHRGWIEMKSAITGNNDHAILAEAEKGEDAAVKNYREALSKDLPSDIRTVIERQYRDVQAAHQTVRALRDGSSMTSGAGTSSTRVY